jgi:hypothetical protein
MGIFQGNFNPDSTFTSDIGSVTRLATSAPFQRYLTEEIFQNSSFVTSGILSPSPLLSGVQGTRVEVPFFAPLNYIEERVDSSDSWGLNQSGYYTSQKTSAKTQYATITTRGAMFSADDLSRYETGEDALANIRSQLARDMARKMNQKLISQVWGLLSADGAPLKESNSCDVSTCTGDVTIANTLSPTTVTGAKYLLGERAQELNAIAVHPDVAAWLETAGMLTYTNVTDTSQAASTIWGSGGIGLTSTQVRVFAGLRMVVDEQLPVICNENGPAQYYCYLFGDGVMLTGEQFPLQIETERNIASLQNAMAVTYSNVMHVVGTSWNSVHDGPTNEQLRDPSNWSLAYCDPRLIPMVELVVNTDVTCLPTDATCVGN